MANKVDQNRKTMARHFRHAVVAATDDPQLLALMLRTGRVVSGRRILETGLPDDPEGAKAVQRVLMRISRAVQAEVGKGAKISRADSLAEKSRRVREVIADLRLALPAGYSALSESIADLDARLAAGFADSDLGGTSA